MCSAGGLRHRLMGIRGAEAVQSCVVNKSIGLSKPASRQKSVIECHSNCTKLHSILLHSPEAAAPITLRPLVLYLELIEHGLLL